MGRTFTYLVSVCAWAVIVGIWADRARGQIEQERAPLQTGARVFVAELDNAARAHLRRAELFCNSGHDEEAIDTIRRVIEESGDSLIALRPGQGLDDTAPVSRDFTRFVTIRRYCYRWLAEKVREAPEALALYRAQVDPQAERWLQAALQERDDQKLQYIMDAWFLSSSGDQALLHWGDAALERGHFRQSRGAWERLSPVFRLPGGEDPWLAEREGLPWFAVLRDVDWQSSWETWEPLLRATAKRPSWLAYPDTDIDLATIRARLILVSILEGNMRRATLELELLRRLHPESEGRLGSQRGKFVTILESLLKERAQWPTRPPDAQWTTFGGNAARGKRAATEVDVALRPIWQIDLPRRTAGIGSQAEGGLRVAEGSDGLLSYHPVVWNDLVVVETGTRDSDFEAVHLRTGEERFPRTDAAVIVGDEETAAGLEVARYTMTVENGRLYARIGSPLTGSQRGQRDRLPPCRLVGLDLETDRKMFLDIRLDAADWGSGWAFDGTPVADGASLYVALRRREAGRAELQVASFDALSGALRWHRPICSGEVLDPTHSQDVTNDLLALDEDTLYFNTNLGAVAALRASDGTVQWLTTYPRVPLERNDPDRNELYRFRDLTPCLVFRDMVFVAPRDTPAVFALDATTGHVLWKNEQVVDAVHLLGVAADRLILSGDCLYWLDAARGHFRGQFPQSTNSVPGHARPRPRGWGRGVLAGSRVYWPTRDTIYLFEQPTRISLGRWEPDLVRTIPLSMFGVKGGNLVISQEILLVASSDRLVAFNETGRLDHARRP